MARSCILVLFLVAATSGMLVAGSAPAQESAAQAPAGSGASAAETALVAESRALLERIEAARAEIADLRAQVDEAEGEQRKILERRRFDKSTAALDDLHRLVANVALLEEQGQDTGRFRAAARDLLQIVARLSRQRTGTLQEEIRALESRREDVSGEDLIELESEITERAALLDRTLEVAAENVSRMESLGLDAREQQAWLSGVLEERAEDMAARLELALEQQDALRQRLQESPDDAGLKTQLSALEKKRQRATASLTATIGVMSSLGMASADYQQLIIESTGQITTDILDKDVALGLLARWTQRLRDWLSESGPVLLFKFLVFVLILLATQVVSRAVRRLVERAVQSSRLEFSHLLQKMFVSTAGNVVWALGLLVALSQLGFSLGPILAGFGIAGFIVGFALQDTLGNFASGMMILIYRPYDVGDMIEAAGVFGKVDAMSMVSTTILTIDNQTLVVPNGKIWGDVIKNITHQKIRRVDMTFGVSYSDDIPHVEKVLASILEDHPKVLDEPEPMIKLHTLNESSVDFVVRPWVKTADYWEVYWDVTREVKMRFDREGISIPFPQRDLHLHEKGKANGDSTRAR